MGAGIVAIIGMLAVFDPTTTGWPLHCPVKLITGLQCPACGTQRAVHALLHGRFQEAIHYNLFLLYALPYLILLILGQLLPKSPWQRKLTRFAEHPRMVGLYIALFMLWFVLRNIMKM